MRAARARRATRTPGRRFFTEVILSHRACELGQSTRRKTTKECQPKSPTKLIDCAATSKRQRRRSQGRCRRRTSPCEPEFGPGVERETHSQPFAYSMCGHLAWIPYSDQFLADCTRVPSPPQRIPQQSGKPCCRMRGMAFRARPIPVQIKVKLLNDLPEMRRGERGRRAVLHELPRHVALQMPELRAHANARRHVRELRREFQPFLGQLSRAEVKRRAASQNRQVQE